MSFCLSPFTLPGGAPAVKKGGSLPPPAPLSCGAPARRAGGGRARRSLASLFHNGRGKCLSFRVRCGVSGKSCTTTARTPPSEREALWLSVACHPSMSLPPSERVTPILRHFLDPRRWKSLIIPESLKSGFCCWNWWIFLMAASRPLSRSTVSQSASSVACPRASALGLARFRD